MTWARLGGVLCSGLLAVVPVWAECEPQARVAVAWANDYVAHVAPQAIRLDSAQPLSLQQWLTQHPLVSPILVKAHQRLEAQGRRKDPELGWGFDLLLDAQDTPDLGFVFDRCLPAPGHVQLKGVNWPEFKLTVRVGQRATRQASVEGAGAVGIASRWRQKR